MHAVGIVLHPQRDSKEAVDAILGWASGNGATVYGIGDEISRLNCAATAVTAEEMAKRADLIVSLGGDGTMLRAMRLADGQRAPVLGVNLGKLGFLAEVDVPDLPDALSAIDARDYTVEPRLAVRQPGRRRARHGVQRHRRGPGARRHGGGVAPGGRAAVRLVRGRRRGRRHAHRLHRLQLLGGRPDRQPGRRSAARDARRAAFGLQPGACALGDRTRSRSRCCRGAVSSPSRWTVRSPATWGPATRSRSMRVPPPPGWSGSATPRSTSALGASCGSPTPPRSSRRASRARPGNYLK